MLAHESPFVIFYPLRNITYLVILSVHLVFFLGCLFGKGTRKIEIKTKLEKRTIQEKKEIAGKTIFILSILAATSIIPNFVHNIRIYGFRVFLNFGKMYYDTMFIAQESAFSFSNMIFIISVLLGYYIINFSFNKYLILSIVDIILFTLSQGSRGSILMILMFFLAPLTAVRKSGSGFEMNKKNKRRINLVIIFLITVVFVSTISRKKLSGTQSTFVGIIINFVSGYFGAGIACLNEFLKDPVCVNFPQYFLRVPFIIFNKIGLTSIDTRFWIDTYFTPSPSNVISYIGELYHDFGYLLYPVAFIMAFFYSYSFEKTQNNSLAWILVYSSFFMIYMLSFFTNFIHISPPWYVVLIGVPLALNVEYKTVVLAFGKR